MGASSSQGKQTKPDWAMGVEEFAEEVQMEEK
jgi:hypothetical protein